MIVVVIICDRNIFISFLFRFVLDQHVEWCFYSDSTQQKIPT